MNLSSRLQRLEHRQGGDTCPHLPPLVEWRGQPGNTTRYPGDAYEHPAPDTRACSCGRLRRQIVVNRAEKRPV